MNANRYTMQSDGTVQTFLKLPKNLVDKFIESKNLARESKRSVKIMNAYIQQHMIQELGYKEPTKSASELLLEASIFVEELETRNKNLQSENFDLMFGDLI